MPGQADQLAQSLARIQASASEIKRLQEAFDVEVESQRMRQTVTGPNAVLAWCDSIKKYLASADEFNARASVARDYTARGAFSATAEDLEVMAAKMHKALELFAVSQPPTGGSKFAALQLACLRDERRRKAPISGGTALTLAKVGLNVARAFFLRH